MKPPYRPAKAKINLKSIQHNLRVAKSHAGTASVLAVIKADAYGHGLDSIAVALQQDADEFGVASIDDVMRLREAGIQQAVVCLSGFYHLDEVPLFIENNAIAVVYDESQLANLRAYSLKAEESSKFRIWLKVDTGMGRLGFQAADVERLVAELNQLTGVELVGVLTHFANADDPSDEKNQQQLDSFTGIVDKLLPMYPQLKYSMSNSAMILSRPHSALDLIRPGIMLYGTSPIAKQSAKSLGLHSVMTFESELISVRNVKQGTTVGYGSTWEAPIDMCVGVVAVGYGDGYPRHASTGTPVLVKGQRTQLIGRVSMDLISVDLSSIDAKVGDKVILWGEGLPVDEVAAHAGTISYELLCGVTKRVKKVFED